MAGFKHSNLFYDSFLYLFDCPLAARIGNQLLYSSPWQARNVTRKYASKQPVCTYCKEGHTSTSKVHKDHAVITDSNNQARETLLHLLSASLCFTMLLKDLVLKVQ